MKYTILLVQHQSTPPTITTNHQPPLSNSHRVPRIRNLPVAGQSVARLLVEPVPNVGILALPEPSAGHVTRLVKVVPGEPAVRRLQALQGHGDPGTCGRVVVLGGGAALLQPKGFVLDLK